MEACNPEEGVEVLVAGLAEDSEVEEMVVEGEKVEEGGIIEMENIFSIFLFLSVYFTQSLFTV